MPWTPEFVAKGGRDEAALQRMVAHLETGRRAAS